MSNKKQCRPKPTIGRQAQDKIGRELRVMYSEVLREPLPAELLSVLQAFEDARAAQQRLQHAVQVLRWANMGFALNPDARSGESLVHAHSTRAPQRRDRLRCAHYSRSQRRARTEAPKAEPLSPRVSL